MSHVRSAQGTDTTAAVRNNVTPLFPFRRHTLTDPPLSTRRLANTLRFDASCDPFRDPHPADVVQPIEESVRRWGTTRISLFDPSEEKVVLEDPANQTSAPRRRKLRSRRWRKSKVLVYKAVLSSIAGTLGNAGKAGQIRNDRLPWRKIGSRRWRRSSESRDR